MNRLLWSLSCLLVFALAGCGGAPTEPPGPPPKTEVIKEKDGTIIEKTTDSL
jgi:hypothetical protein